MRHVEKVYSVKTNSQELCKYSLSNVTLESFKSWNWVEVDPSFFRWSLKKNIANGKEAHQEDQVQACLLSYLSNESLVYS